MAPQPQIPAALPPSVEEAYRRKCVQLRNRTAEVEDSNTAAKIRLARIRRQVEKLRIERAFLLEQIARRTSTNVEDSDGSPSPPPTPKDKPLRVKRGHRKPGTDLDAKPPSPSSETFSHQQDTTTGGANGTHKPSEGPATAFELYCREKRPVLKDDVKDPESTVEEELAQRWKDMPDAERDEFQVKLEEQKTTRSPSAGKNGEVDLTEADKKGDDDVEMANYDTEDQDAPMEKDAEDQDAPMEKDAED